jgi:Anti-sigma factor NepR
VHNYTCVRAQLLLPMGVSQTGVFQLVVRAPHELGESEDVMADKQGKQKSPLTPTSAINVDHRLRSNEHAWKAEQIKQQLKNVYDEVLQEPLPNNLLDLIAELDKRD